MRNLNRIISSFLNRFSSEICANQSAASATAKSSGVAGRHIETLEKRMMLTANVSGTVFNDLNDDGAYETGEPGIAGITVYIDLNGSDTLTGNDPVATTDANGNYTLTGIIPGDFVIREIPAAGTTQTSPANGAGDHVTVGSIDVTGQNFGNFVPSNTFSIIGTVFNDFNDNGQFDNGETGIAGVTVYIDSNDSHVYQVSDPHTTTDANGLYTFTGIPAGNYVVREVVPPNQSQTFPTANAGQHVTLTSISSEGVNFGNFTPDGAVTEADMNVIQGYAFDPTNLSNQVDVEIVIAGGPTQEIVANQTNASLQGIIGSTTHEFTYSTPELSVGVHTVQIFVINPTNNATNLLATETLNSQNSLFDEHYYLQEYPNVAAAVKAGQFATGYDHYIEYGQYEGYNPSPYWNEGYYLKQNPDVAAAVQAGTVSSGFMHFYLYGQYENRPGLLYFNSSYYLTNNPDVATAVAQGQFTSGYEHFVLYGQYEGRSPMKYFSSAMYDAYNSDILPFVTGEGFSSDFEQFVEYGQYEGRIASAFYNETVYLNDNPDVAAAVSDGQFPDGFQHWLEYGQYEGRTA